jgi:hypothetical protein
LQGFTEKERELAPEDTEGGAQRRTQRGRTCGNGAETGLIVLKIEAECGVTSEDGEVLGWEGAFETASVSPDPAGLKCGVMEAPGFGHAEVSGDTRM